MSKKNNGTKSAAEAAAAKQQAPQEKQPDKVNVVDLRDFDPTKPQNGFGSLDANHTVDLLKMSHETFRMDPNAAAHNGISQEVVDTMNRVNAIGQVAMIAVQAQMDNTPFANAIKKTLLPDIIEAARILGIVIDQKLLPAPDKDGMVALTSNAIKPTKEAKAAIKKEIEASKKVVKNDPTKIENDDELRDTLLNILSINASGGFYNKISDAVAFYNSYKELEATKSNDTKRVENIKSRPFADSLLEVSQFIGKCPFTIGGLANFMFEKTMESKNPVVAFCSFRDASLNKTTGMPSVDDHIVADIVKVFVKWCADSKIEEANASIAACKKNIEALGSDKKKNEKAIKANEAEIKRIEGKIAEYNAATAYAMSPSIETVKTFVEAYNDNKHEGFKNARMTASKILNSYYPGIKIKDVEPDNLMVVLEQYFGVILNFFLPPVDQFVMYSEKNIPELKKVESKEEKPAEEEPKKALRKRMTPQKVYSTAQSRSGDLGSRTSLKSLNKSFQNMRKITTILCSIAFLFSGIFIAMNQDVTVSASGGYKQLSAATMPQYQVPNFGTNGVVVPLDLLLDQAKKSVPETSVVTADDLDDLVKDSLKNRIKYLESKKQVTKVKWRTAPAPPPIVETKLVHDTVYKTVEVPIYYLATQKHGPGDCTTVYELRQVDEICKDQLLPRRGTS